MSKYANKTTVTIEKSKTDIEKTLRKYGADGFYSGWQDCRAAIGFQMGGRTIRLEVSIPPIQEFERNKAGKRVGAKSAEAAQEQAERQRWRAVLLIVKAKLEAVECGISTIEKEFLADIVLPDNTLLGDFIHPQIEAAYGSGKMPALLPARRKAKK